MQNVIAQDIPTDVLIKTLNGGAAQGPQTQIGPIQLRNIEAEREAKMIPEGIYIGILESITQGQLQIKPIPRKDGTIWEKPIQLLTWRFGTASGPIETKTDSDLEEGGWLTSFLCRATRQSFQDLDRLSRSGQLNLDTLIGSKFLLAVTHEQRVGKSRKYVNVCAFPFSALAEPQAEPPVSPAN